MTNMPGPGDPITWGPPTGHPNDPRTDDACDYLDIVDPNEWPCPTCHGHIIIGQSTTDPTIYVSPAEHTDTHAAVRYSDGRLRMIPDREIIDYIDHHGIPVCPTCNGEGHHPDAVCHTHHLDPAVLDDHGNPSGVCANCFLKAEREEAAIRRAGL